jgi:hypothetical protein
MARFIIRFPDDYNPIKAVSRVLKVIEQGRISDNSTSYCSATSWKDKTVILSKKWPKCDSFLVYIEKERKGKKPRTPTVWIDDNLKVLEEACMICDSWRFGNNPIEKYLKDHGVITTWSSAASMATKKKYPRPHMVKGGKR